MGRSMVDFTFAVKNEQIFSIQEAEEIDISTNREHECFLREDSSGWSFKRGEGYRDRTALVKTVKR